MNILLPPVAIRKCRDSWIRGKNNINIFVMHPAGRTSPIQERQMTSVLDKNVFNLAVERTFDIANLIMKTTFADVPFKQAHSLGAVNSVNWARVLAQMVYYFYATFDVQKRTGNRRFVSRCRRKFWRYFGGICYAMGLPIEQLILATNENDILTRFFNTGVYGKATVVPNH